jgi:hypothetical protein
MELMILSQRYHHPPKVLVRVRGLVLVLVCRQERGVSGCWEVKGVGDNGRGR